MPSKSGIYEDDVWKNAKTGSSGRPLQIESQLLSSSSRRTIGFVKLYLDQVKFILYNTHDYFWELAKVYVLPIDENYAKRILNAIAPIFKPAQFFR